MDYLQGVPKFNEKIYSIFERYKDQIDEFIEKEKVWSVKGETFRDNLPPWIHKLEKEMEMCHTISPNPLDTLNSQTLVYYTEFYHTVKQILDEIFKQPDGTYFDQITLTVTPDGGGPRDEITVASDVISTDCLYNSLYWEMHPESEDPPECIQKLNILKFQLHENYVQDIIMKNLSERDQVTN